ncbi:MAG: rod shape-determining protein MreD, partial [Ferruginibacter sp.]
MPRFLKYGFQFALLILIQALVLDKVQLHHWITPYIYFAFILWLPFDVSRPMLLILSFVLGLTVDSFRQHPGFHAAACVLIAYV